MSPLRILVVDDSAVAGSRLSSLLGSVEGVEVLPQAWDVAGARRAFLTGAPDLVVTDFQLPDGTGVDVIRHVKTTWPETLVCVLTNYPWAPNRRRCLDAGADLFLDKSTEFDALLEVCREFLASRPDRRGGSGDPAGNPRN
jgi:DNA-binding NarL/FixJ family response regulator